MPFLSEFVKRPVVDITGKRVGKLTDVIVSGDKPYPKVKALRIHTLDKNDVNVPWGQVQDLGRQIKLNVELHEVRAYSQQEHEVQLVSDVLDRQVVDVEGKKLRRVNDLQFSRINGYYRLIGVDIGVTGVPEDSDWRDLLRA